MQKTILKKNKNNVEESFIFGSLTLVISIGFEIHSSMLPSHFITPGYPILGQAFYFPILLFSYARMRSERLRIEG